MFLLIFEQICQALAYAHARGVIHRDLKPANVMVGSFGEVQVMDWGLAKVLSEPNREHERAEHSAVRTHRSESAGSESQTGSVLGTPAYMPPEQARGETHRIDERADVFGFGAILCDILTGRPPFTGEKVTDVLHKAATNDLTDAFARLDKCGADDEMIRLARACLDPNRDARPRHAGAVADRTAAYRAGVSERLHRAEVERAAADARAEEAQARAAAEALARQEAQAKARAERRARRMTLGLAASVLLTVILGGGTAAYLRQQQLVRRAEEARTLAEVTGAINDNVRQATESLRAADWPAARTALVRADARLGAAPVPEEMREQVQKLKADLALAARLDDTRQEQTNEAAGGDFDYARAETIYRDAFAGAGLNPETDDVAAGAELIRASPIRAQLVEALDDWALVKGRLKTAGRERLLELAGAADEDEWRKGFRTALAKDDVAAMKRLAAAPEAAEQTPATLALVGYALNRAGERQPAVVVLRAAQRRYPTDFWLNQRLGLYLLKDGTADPEDAVGYFRAAVAQRPQSPALTNLAAALYRAGKLAEAEDLYRAFCERRADDADARRHLALVLNAAKKFADAEKAAREAIRLDPALGQAHNELGVALQSQGNDAGAIAAYTEARRLNPKDPAPCRNLGALNEKLSRADAAEKEYREAAHRDPQSAGRSATWAPS